MYTLRVFSMALYASGSLVLSANVRRWPPSWRPTIRRCASFGCTNRCVPSIPSSGAAPKNSRIYVADGKLKL